MKFVNRTLLFCASTLFVCCSVASAEKNPLFGVWKGKAILEGYEAEGFTVNVETNPKTTLRVARFGRKQARIFLTLGELGGVLDPVVLSSARLEIEGELRMPDPTCRARYILNVAARRRRRSSLLYFQQVICQDGRFAGFQYRANLRKRKKKRGKR